MIHNSKSALERQCNEDEHLVKQIILKRWAIENVDANNAKRVKIHIL